MTPLITPSRKLADYGIVLVLIVVVAAFSVATIGETAADGAPGGEALAATLRGVLPPGAKVAVVTRDLAIDRAFAAALSEHAAAAKLDIVAVVHGDPSAARKLLATLEAAGTRLDAVAATPEAAAWSVLHDIAGRHPKLGPVRVFSPITYRWPRFLTWDNLINIANQSAIHAILAIGMTFVIIVGGIDLSIGSLIALSAVTATYLIREVAGAYDATPLGMILACVAGIAVCALFGLATGLFVTVADMPPFIVTLGMMLIARGLAYVLAENQSIYQVPASFSWLGRDADIAGIPNVVVLMGVLYVLAHVMMTRTVPGRYIYAIGSNKKAAWLSGVPVRRVLLFVYVASAALAGLGGVIQASLLRSASPIYGEYYELYVIAAVVVGGASLSGGEGRIVGTLLGTLLIVVIQVGMNMVGIDSNWQKVVFGVVILGAVLLDRLKRQG